MSSEFGERVRVSLFGESHGRAVGALISGLMPGEAIDLDEIRIFMDRRRGGKGDYVTKRCEADEVEILSGLYRGFTTGAPLMLIIGNADARPGDYEKIGNCPRPSHADYAARVKYDGFCDLRGGGHFSGRLTAPLCAAGAICGQILARRGVTTGAHLFEAAGISDAPFDPINLTADSLSCARSLAFPALDDLAGETMRAEIARAASEGDSVGGVVECAAAGLPVGLGEPLFDGVENAIARAVFGIGAVRGIEFGAGFAAARMRGSEHNDEFILKDGRVSTRTNRHGGVLGGMASGMPLIFRVAFKPTPSIARAQRTVDFSRMAECDLFISGRHDPCVAVRAVPCVEAAANCVLLDLMTIKGDYYGA